MNQSLFLSIIIPVYNAASCIKRCLDSIWAQGMNESEYEVICVNDCSTDNTLEVLEEIQKSHPNMKVVSNDANLRAGGSRNHGVRLAGGEYICFIDADDYFEIPVFIDLLAYLQSDKLDILMCDFARETEKNKNNNFNIFGHSNIVDGRTFMLTNGCPWGPCRYIFKRSLMLENEVFFEENVCCEDVDWVHRLTLFAKTIQYMPILLSHVVINEQSTTATEHLKLKSVSEKFFAGWRMYQLGQSYSHDIEVKKRFDAIAITYFKQGVRYFSAIGGAIKNKKKIIERYIPLELSLSLPLRLVRTFPTLYSIITNISAPLMKTAIGLKRKYKGR